MSEIDLQTLFNAGVTIITMAGGWFLRSIWEAITDLQKSDREIVQDIAQVKEIVAGNYMKRSELLPRLDRMESNIDRKMDQIYNKLDMKADK